MKEEIRTQELALSNVIGDLVAEASPEVPLLESTPEVPLVLTHAAIMKRAAERAMVKEISGDAYVPGRAVGHRLKRMAGRILRDTTGRRFELCRVKVNVNSLPTYHINFLPADDEISTVKNH